MKTQTRIILIACAGLLVLLAACTPTSAPVVPPAPMTSMTVTTMVSPATPGATQTSTSTHVVPVPTLTPTIPAQTPAPPTRVPTAAFFVPTFTPEPTKTPFPETPYVPPPTVDWHARWITYTNQTLGFSVQYPSSGGEVIETKDEVYLNVLVRPSLRGYMIVGFRVQPNLDNLPADEIYKRDWAESDKHRKVPPILQSAVDRFNHSGYSTAHGLFATEGAVDTFWILVSHKSKVYIIWLTFGSYTDMDDSDYQSQFARMINTFQFIDR